MMPIAWLLTFFVKPIALTPKQLLRLGRGLDAQQVRVVQVRDELDDLRLRRRQVGVPIKDDVPRLFNRAHAIEQPDKLVRHRVQPVELVRRRVVHDVPALAAVPLTRDLHVRTQPGPRRRDAVPVRTKC